MIWIPNQLVGASLGADVAVDCNLESHPRSVTYWTRGTDRVIHQNAKYSAVTMQQAMYKVRMQLVIHWVRAEDYGEYHCMAKNTLGETQGTIKLYETSTSSSETFDSKLASQGLRGTLHDEQQKSSQDWRSSVIGNCASFHCITSSTLPAMLFVGALSILATAPS